jgi:hypothetical protein
VYWALWGACESLSGASLGGTPATLTRTPGTLCASFAARPYHRFWAGWRVGPVGSGSPVRRGSTVAGARCRTAIRTRTPAAGGSSQAGPSSPISYASRCGPGRTAVEDCATSTDPSPVLRRRSTPDCSSGRASHALEIGTMAWRLAAAAHRAGPRRLRLRTVTDVISDPAVSSSAALPSRVGVLRGSGRRSSRAARGCRRDGDPVRGRCERKEAPCSRSDG